MTLSGSRGHSIEKLAEVNILELLSALSGRLWTNAVILLLRTANCSEQKKKERKNAPHFIAPTNFSNR